MKRLLFRLDDLIAETTAPRTTDQDWRDWPVAGLSDGSADLERAFHALGALFEGAQYLPQGRLCAGLATAARIDQGVKHRSPT